MDYSGYIQRVQTYPFSKLSITIGDREDIYTVLEVWPYGEYTIQVVNRPELKETHVHVDSPLGEGVNVEYAFDTKEGAYHFALRIMDALNQASKLWDF